MPRIINKTTGYTEQISIDQWEKIQANPMTANLFEMTETKVPEELNHQDHTVKRGPKKTVIKEDVPSGEPANSDQ